MTIPATIGLVVRALAFGGTRHRCPVCGWRARAFAGPRGSFRTRDTGYCARCNSKSRHRFAFHTLEMLSTRQEGRWLLVAPSYCERRALGRWPDVIVVAPEGGPGVDLAADLEDLPFPSGSFEGVVAIHVLEHVDDDDAALSEIARVLAPGGRAVLGVPHDGRASTDEDPSVVDPEERRIRFGERDHRRAYGRDVVERIRAHDLEVRVWVSSELDEDVARLVGVRPDELLALAGKPG